MSINRTIPHRRPKLSYERFLTPLKFLQNDGTDELGRRGVIRSTRCDRVNRTVFTPTALHIKAQGRERQRAHPGLGP